MLNYKDTIFLPKTSFPLQQNNAHMEEITLQRWQKIDLYQKIRQQSQGCDKFILHLGPPFANGHLHIGHVLTYTLKDIVTRTRQMLGLDAPLVPGWDCHGLPIEWKVEEQYRQQGKSKDQISLKDFRQECRVFAEYWINIQRQEAMRLGIQADWQNPYLTMDKQAEAEIVATLFQFLKSGALYQGIKPVMWSVVEKTALAEAEIEYKDHRSQAIFVRFPIQSSSLTALKDSCVVIWTTTPWSLPGNRAIAYSQDMDYALVEVNSVSAEDQSCSLIVKEKLVIAEVLVNKLCQQFGATDYKILASFKGKDLSDTCCYHPLSSFGYLHKVPLIKADHVSASTGSGLVHIAPSHGPEDFAVAKVYQLEIPDLITDDGKFRDSVPLVANEHVFKASEKIISSLIATNNLVSKQAIVHSYPHSWRSKAPLIYRTTNQWFISMEKPELRNKALAVVSQVQWIPEQSKNRIYAMLKGRPDWCLSRQRSWGIPLPLFVAKADGKVLIDDNVNKRIIDAFNQHSCEAWFELGAQFFLGEDYKASDFKQVRDILDVWFESGATQNFVLKGRPDLAFLADVYLEGSDQHRGWFQSSLLIGCSTNNQAPFKTVVTHGFVLDEHGHKLSKSLGNGIVTQEIIDKKGAELLRLWVVSSDYSGDCRIGPEILKHLEDMYRRFRNTIRYLLGALAGNELLNLVDDLPELEQWVLHRLNEIDKLYRDCIDRYDFLTLINELHNFCANDLSAFYLDIGKDRLYCDGYSSKKRQAQQATLATILDRLLKWLAPFLCFTADEAWLSWKGNINDSVHLQQFAPIIPNWYNPALAVKFAKLRLQKRLCTGALEKARTQGVIGSSLQAHLKVYDPLAQLFQDVDYAELVIVSKVEIVIEAPKIEVFSLGETPDLGVQVTHASGQKCQRCWKVLEEVGSQSDYLDLCQRCTGVVRAFNHN